MRVLDVMRKLSFGKIYRVWVDEAELIDVLQAESPPDATRRTLANMQSRGILLAGAGKLRSSCDQAVSSLACRANAA